MSSYGVTFPQHLHDGIRSHISLSGDNDTGKGAATGDYIGFYQKYLSAARGSRCAMYPSCSNYGLQAFKEKPFAEAMAMTADRMIRCGHDGKYYDYTYAYGYLSLIDLTGDSVPAHLKSATRGYVVTDRLPRKTKQDSIVDFVHYLINNHHYELAMLEIERIAYFQPKLFTPSLFKQKLLCYDGLDRQEEGILEFSNLKRQDIATDNQTLYEMSRLYKHVENFDCEREMLKKIRLADRDTSYKVNIGIAVSYLNQDEENKARPFVLRANTLAPDSSFVRKNLETLSYLQTTKKKNPRTAGLLSIFPGGGYLYAGHKASALTAFLINGVLGCATYTSIKRKNYGVAAVMASFTVTFYAGNIMGAIKSVRRHNQKRTERCAKQLERQNFINP